MKSSEETQREPLALAGKKKARRRRGVLVDGAVLKSILHELSLRRDALAVYSKLGITTVRNMQAGKPVDCASVRKAAKRLSELTGRSIALGDLVKRDMTGK